MCVCVCVCVCVYICIYMYTYILFASIPVIISTRAEETPTRGGKKKQHNTYSVSSSQVTVQTLTTLLLTLYKRKKEKKQNKTYSVSSGQVNVQTLLYYLHFTKFNSLHSSVHAHTYILLTFYPCSSGHGHGHGPGRAGEAQKERKRKRK